MKTYTNVVELFRGNTETVITNSKIEVDTDTSGWVARISMYYDGVKFAVNNGGYEYLFLTDAVYNKQCNYYIRKLKEYASNHSAFSLVREDDTMLFYSTEL